jgi:hypothetical protein
MKGESQGFGNTTAAKLRYNCDMTRLGGILLYANWGVYEQ